MATQSTIIVKISENEYHSVYCHFDGYPEHQMPILRQNYSSPELAKELVRHGDMSVLAEKCNGSETHSYENPDFQQTIYYGRDRGEKNTEYKVYDTLNEAINKSNGYYTYIFEDEWRVY